MIQFEGLLRIHGCNIKQYYVNIADFNYRPSCCHIDNIKYIK